MKPMWQKLSLRARINLLLALVLGLGLVINIARLVLDGGPRVQAQDQSVTRLAREFIETIVADLNQAPDPDAKLQQLTGDLNKLRHVSITRRNEGETSPGSDLVADADGARRPPAWFVTLIHPETTSVEVPLSVGGKQERLVITSDPNDEVA